MNISQPEHGGNGENFVVVNQWLRGWPAGLRADRPKPRLAIRTAFPLRGRVGRVAEWFKAPVLKCERGSCHQMALSPFLFNFRQVGLIG